MAIALNAQTSGTLASGTTATITLPTYATTDYIVLVLSRNQAQASPFTFSAAVTSITELAEAGGSRRVTAMRIVPNGAGQTTFTLTATTSSVWSWWIASYSGVNASATVASATNTIGNSTTSTIEIPNTVLPYISTGTELAFAAGGVNATATWTTDARTIYSTGTSANAGLMVNRATLASGVQTSVPGNMDRGLAGTTRSESAISFVLQAAGSTPVKNLLTNGSFEQGTTLATGWADEHVTASQFTYSLVSSGTVDGGLAQQIAYTGQAGDNGTTSKGEIYQSSVTGMSAGDTLIFSCWVSGSWTNIYGIIGIEAFDATSTYISESDATITTLTGTPTKYSVTYVCPPGTSFVAVYLQFPGVASTTTFSVIMDDARLLLSAGAGATLAAVVAGSTGGVVGSGISASVAASVATSAAGTVGSVGGASLSATVSAVAAGTVGVGSGAALTVTVATSAGSASVSNLTGAAALSAALAAAAAGSVGISAGAALTATVSTSAGGSAGVAAGAAGVVSVAVAAAGQVGNVTAAALNVTVTAAADGSVLSASGTGAVLGVTLGGSAAGFVGLTQGASLTVAVVSAAAGVATHNIALWRDLTLTTELLADTWFAELVPDVWAAELESD